MNAWDKGRVPAPVQLLAHHNSPKSHQNWKSVSTASLHAASDHSLSADSVSPQQLIQPFLYLGMLHSNLLRCSLQLYLDTDDVSSSAGINSILAKTNISANLLTTRAPTSHFSQKLQRRQSCLLSFNKCSICFTRLRALNGTIFRELKPSYILKRQGMCTCL